jgi:hypothetical protein
MEESMKYRRIFFFYEDDFDIAELTSEESIALPKLMESPEAQKAHLIVGYDEHGQPFALKDRDVDVGTNPLNWDQVPWTDFVEGSVSHYPEAVRPHKSFINSIYQVSVWYEEHPKYGLFAHLSFKTHDRAPRHDWREMQRIKNELCGTETFAVELYPEESRVVDTSNQYHLFAFRDFKLELGFTERLVAEGNYDKAVQRPWRKELRPHDLTSKEDMQRNAKELLKKK